MFIDTSAETTPLRTSAGRAPLVAFAPTLLAAALTCLPVTVARAQAADDRTPSTLERTVDANIKPGDDFFAYANGSWLKATQIPTGKERWGARDEINAVTGQRVAKMLDEASAAPAGSATRKVADFRAAYMNEAAIEASGLKPIQPLLDKIGSIQNKTALARMLGSEMRADVEPLNMGIYRSANILGLATSRSLHGERSYSAFLVQGGLGLGDRERYIGADAGMRELRSQYEQYIGRLLAIAGFDRPDERARSVVALETAVAQSHATRETSANDHNADNRWTRADFARRAPGMDWNAFFAAAGLAKQDSFTVWQPSAVIGLAALVSSQPLEAWKNYLRFHLLDALADVLPRPFAEEGAAMRTAVSGQTAQAPRTERALEAALTAMGEAIGRIYVDEYFPADQKARIQTIVANVATAFARRVQAVTWMSPDTRAIALAKLSKLYVGIGYPEHWQDYSDLTIEPGDPVGNIRRAAERNYRRVAARAGQPIDVTEWWVSPQMAGAVLVFEQNAYDFSAALLQPPKFDPAASDAATYGAIGAIIGHDISHFVDVLGADFDTTGRARRWWTAEDSLRFETAAEPLVAQFSSYQPYPDLRVNGKLTRTENVADMGGLAAAFDAYRSTLGANAFDKEYVRRHDREFFIAFAQSWRSRISDAALRTQLASNDHAPESIRVSTVRNFDAWYDAFDVVPGQRLYLAREARVHIW